jgi:hypothetical protein
MKKPGSDIVAVGAYTVLALLATYPLVLEAGRAIPPGGDSWVYYWNLWWVKDSLLEKHVNPYFAPDLYFPYGATLYLHALNLLASILALPVTVTLGIPAAFNFLVLLSFVLSGYGTYRLVLFATAPTNPEPGASERDMQLAAFVAGSAFAFCSYRYVHLIGHLDLLSTQWLPLFVLFLLKTRDGGGTRNVVLAATFLAAAIWTSPYYVLFLLVVVAYVLVELVMRLRRRAIRPVLRIAMVGIIFTILVSPVLVPMLMVGRTEGRSVNPSSDVDRFSADLLAFIVPSPIHPIWQDIVAPIYQTITRPGGNLEIVAFVGFVPLLLGIAGLWQSRTMRTFWLPLTMLFAALALGPVVYIAGRSILPQMSFLMPYRLLTLMPYGDIPRVPARFVIMTILCLSVIAACGARMLLQRFRPGARLTIAALLTLLAVGENAAVPIAMMYPNAPAFFEQIRNDPRRAAVLEVPIPDDPATLPVRMLYQTIHQKPIYGGYLSRATPPLPFNSVPGFAQFRMLSGGIDDVTVYEPAQLRAISRAVLNLYSAGYVVIEKNFMKPAAIDQARLVADDLLGSSARVHEDEVVLAYTVPAADSAAPAAVWLDSGWSYLERLPEPGPDGRPLRWRWMGQRARLGLLAGDSVPVQLKFVAQAYQRTRRVQLTLNGSEIATIAISTDRAEYRTPAFQMPPGSGFVEIKSMDGAEAPGVDARLLSIALFRLELEQKGLEIRKSQ